MKKFLDNCKLFNCKSTKVWSRPLAIIEVRQYTYFLSLSVLFLVLRISALDICSKAWRFSGEKLSIVEGLNILAMADYITWKCDNCTVVAIGNMKYNLWNGKHSQITTYLMINIKMRPNEVWLKYKCTYLTLL